MSKQEDRLEQKSSAKTEVISALADKDLDIVAGGDKAVPQRGKAAAQVEGPKETITFEYGGLVIQYGRQS
jgi:hypothetical protein